MSQGSLLGLFWRDPAEEEPWPRLQVLAAGKVNELVISTAPVILGAGKRLFEGFDRDIDLEVAKVYSAVLSEASADVAMVAAAHLGPAGAGSPWPTRQESPALASCWYKCSRGSKVIKLRNRDADPAPAPPFEGHGPDGAERATFAAGCFWGVEAAFRQIHGVLQTAVGYTGGHVPDPSYERVCRHRTGHAEAVEVWFDPAQVSYAELLQAFWRMHNPTTRNRQGFDIGSQYRSAIFYHDAGQQETAIASRDTEQQSRRRQIVTQITPASAFYRAEEYHQRYLEKHGHAACAATIR